MAHSRCNAALRTDEIVTTSSSTVTACSGDDRLVLGQLSSAMARRLAQDLRRNRGRDVNSTILQRLASSQSFVTNFPTFISELNP